MFQCLQSFSSTSLRLCESSALGPFHRCSLLLVALRHMSSPSASSSSWPFSVRASLCCLPSLSLFSCPQLHLQLVRAASPRCSSFTEVLVSFGRQDPTWRRVAVLVCFALFLVCGGHLQGSAQRSPLSHCRKQGLFIAVHLLCSTNVLYASSLKRCSLPCCY